MFSQYEDRYVEELESDLSKLREKLAKANERVAELEREQLPIENGKNRYGLDVSYFRNVINRELNRPLCDYMPHELARVFARLSLTADKSVMFEPEFSNKFAIEQKIKALEAVESTVLNFSQADEPVSYEQALDEHLEQLRKEQASEYEFREIGETEWTPCDKHWFDYCQKSPEHEARLRKEQE